MENFFNNSNYIERVFDDIFGFGKPSKFYFNSTVKDLMPSFWTKKSDNEYSCVVKTIGIDAEDVKVEEIECGFKVYGETEVEGYKYNTSMELPVVQSIMNEIKEVKISSKNGLTFITLVLDRPEKKKIKIEKI